MKSIRTLLANAIDYAGLFPPAELDMARAVHNYAAYRNGEHAWLLGRFIVPVSQLAAFDRAAEGLLPRSKDEKPWHLSVLAGPDVEADVAEIMNFARRHAKPLEAGAATIDSIEIKVSSQEDVYRATKKIPPSIKAYFEIPISNDPTGLINAIDIAGARAKVRTGGLQPEMLPASSDLIRFIYTCAKTGMPFKATAGLHHPIRSIHPLTGDRNGPSGMMHGFLNVFLAAAFFRAGVKMSEAVELLEEESHEAFRFDEEGISWRAYRVDNDQIMRTRQNLALSFGSCSFQEPIDDLKKINLL